MVVPNTIVLSCVDPVETQIVDDRRCALLNGTCQSIEGCHKSYVSGICPSESSICCFGSKDNIGCITQPIHIPIFWQITYYLNLLYRNIFNNTLVGALEWPLGSFGLVMSTFGCPQSYDGVWVEGGWTLDNGNKSYNINTGMKFDITIRIKYRICRCK